jgi:hexosaminidase
MVWVYEEKPYQYVAIDIWDKFAKVFPTAWTASAFKGAESTGTIGKKSTA